MEKLLLIIMLAITVEALVEYGKSIVKWFMSGEWKTAVTQLIAIVVSVIICFSTRADMYKALGVVFDCPTIGILLTGIFASRGANFVSDLIKRIQIISDSKLTK